MKAVFIHGWSASPCAWKPFRSQLAADSHCVSFADVNSADGFLPAVIDALPPEPTVVFGWSMGAILAIEAALTSPDHIAGLVLFAGTPCFCSPYRSRGWPSRVLRRMQQQLHTDPQQCLLDFRKSMFSDSENNAFAELSRACPLPESCGFSPDGLHAGLDYLTRTDLRPSLGSLSCPVLWIHGTHDRICPPGTLTEVPPSHEVLLIPDAGHLPFRTSPLARRAALDFFHRTSSS
jgi:pimeloyl-[acyl-carrier protein] methyl ester esterase